MLSVSLIIAASCLLIAMFANLLHLLRAISKPDQILALDTMYVNTLGFIVLAGIFFKTGFNFEAALLIAMLGFISTVALCKYLLRGDIIE